MIVVCDASPLIFLAKLNRLDLHRSLPTIPGGNGRMNPRHLTVSAAVCVFFGKPTLASPGAVV
jgi:hypothetical protein